MTAPPIGASDSSWIDGLVGVFKEITWDSAWVLDHFLMMAGFGLCVALVLHVLRSHRSPGATFAWLLAIALIPYVGVPLYILIGGRKFRRMAGRKQALFDLPGPRRSHYGGIRGTIERILSTAGMPPARHGNKVTFLPDGQAGYAALVSAIELARESIHLMTFILGDDAVGRDIVERLAEKSREGVKVRLLLDALGCLRTRGRFVDPIRESGGQVGIFMPVTPLRPKWSANLRNHRKICVVDGRTAIIGGMNLAHEYMGPEPDPDRWFDTAARVEGPAAADLGTIFASDWSFATDETLDASRPGGRPAHAGTSRVQVAASGPDTPYDVMYEAMFTAVIEAKHRVWIVTPYFIPDDPLLKALELQTRMGVDVRILVPRHSNHRLADLARGRPLRELAAKGARVFLCSRMIHAKLALVDSTLAAIGSANLDLRSFYLNYEVQLFMYAEGEIKAVAEWMEQRTADSVELEDEPVSMVRAWAEDLGSLVTPLL
jgi:cardiolipin synthase